jgi:hypothetical protein
MHATPITPDEFWSAAVLEPGALITVRRHPQGVGSAMSMDMTVDTITHRIEGLEWETTMDLSPSYTLVSPATPDAFTADAGASGGAVPGPPTSTNDCLILDRFNGSTLNASIWPTTSDADFIAVSGGDLVLSSTGPAITPTLETGSFDWVEDMFVAIEVDWAANSPDDFWLYFQVASSSRSAYMEIGDNESGAFSLGMAGYADDGDFVSPWTPTQRWLRMRKGAGDVVYFETSNDELTWTLRHTGDFDGPTTAVNAVIQFQDLGAKPGASTLRVKTFKVCGGDPPACWLVDTFDGSALNASRWSIVANAGQVSVASGSLRLGRSDGLGAYVQSSAAADFVEGSTVAWQVDWAVSAPASNGYALALYASKSGGLVVGFEAYRFDGTYYLTLFGGTSTEVTLDATDHHWLRLRRGSGTTVVWEGSPDGSTWSTLRSASIAGDATGLRVWMQQVGSNGATVEVMGVEACNP